MNNEGLLDSDLTLDQWLEKTRARTRAIARRPMQEPKPPRQPSKNGNCRTKRSKSEKETPRMRRKKGKAA